jgi:hypothetical protein
MKNFPVETMRTETNVPSKDSSRGTRTCFESNPVDKYLLIGFVVPNKMFSIICQLCDQYFINITNLTLDTKKFQEVLPVLRKENRSETSKTMLLFFPSWFERGHGGEEQPEFPVGRKTALN